MNPFSTPDVPNQAIHLSNPRILAFYEKHAHLSPEMVNLSMIDFFESTATTTASVITPPDSPTSTYQRHEITQTLDQIKHAITQQTASLSALFSQAKANYVNEFCSIWAQSDCVSKREYLLQNNSTIIATLEQLTVDIRNIKGIHRVMGDKVGAIISQFHKIINNNIESILSKTADTAILSKEFIQNFELNAAHTVQTVQQILFDFVSTKETQIKGAMENAVYSKLLYEFNDFLHHIRSTHALDASPNSLEIVLSRLYNTASIESEAVNANTANLFLSRVGKPDIFLQQRAIRDRNIHLDEIKSFVQTAHENVQHGILISQHTGITTKPHLYIEILQNRIFVYVHRLEDFPEKLQTAIDIVDTLSAKLTEFNVSSEEKYTIPKDVLDEINREYQSFINQKESIMNTMKDMYKKVVAQVEDIRFGSLDKYLSTRYSSCKKQGYVCSLCNSFTVSTLKGLAAHKRGCSRKISGVVQKPAEILVKRSEENAFDVCAEVVSIR